ncbi:MAG: hypothetical protein K2X41_12380 [Hyphomicrobium sp.]|nr:hypothetical protein [Hyphomicrobium sp.]
MTPLFELSAAPHLPYSMRAGEPALQQNTIVEFANGVRLVMRNGELHLEIEPAVDRHSDHF